VAGATGFVAGATGAGAGVGAGAGAASRAAFFAALAACAFFKRSISIVRCSSVMAIMFEVYTTTIYLFLNRIKMKYDY
jgi:hypothetical protein